MIFRILSLILLCLALLLPVFSAPVITLSVKERAGLARIGEPVLTGVPLPDSLESDTAAFALKDADGNTIPCEFRTAARWWPDKKSIRWLHVDFKTDIAANETKTFTLIRDPASHAVTGSKLTIADLDGKYQVTTGPLRFTVKKKGVNLFDEVWVDETGGSAFDDAHQVVKSHGKGFSLLSNGVRYSTVNDTAVKVFVERQGPLSAVLRIEGRLKDTAGVSKYWFITRITAYDNSSRVKVVFSFENRDPVIANCVSMHGLNLELPLSLSEKRFGLGGFTGPKTGVLNAGDTAYLNLLRNDSFAYGGVLSEGGSTRDIRCPNLGMAWLSDGAKGVGVSQKWFWQMYPSCVEVSGDGLLNVGLFSQRFRGGSTDYPPRYENHYDVYSGMSRTHEIRFVFYNQKSDSAVQSDLVGVNSRLYALAPAYWFCRITKAFGPMVEKGNPSLFTPENWAKMGRADSAMSTAAKVCLSNQNTFKAGKDAYDYFAWGDIPQASLGDQLTLWNGNYYDLPHLMFLNFAQTLDDKILDFAISRASHVQDMHQCHFEPDNIHDGACRYCPATNHMGDGDVVLGPQVMVQTSHHKTQCLFDNYYITGEERAIDAALEGVKWIKAKRYEGTSLYDLNHFPRRLGNVLNTLLSGFGHNFDPACSTLIAQDLIVMGRSLNGDGLNSSPQLWMAGILLEPLTDAYNFFKQDAYANAVKQILDNTRGAFNSGSAYAVAFCASHFKSPDYLDWASDLYSTLARGMSFAHHETDYACWGRSVPKSFYYFANPDSLNTIPIRVESDSMLPENTPPIQAYPNPFNPTVNLVFNFTKARGEGDAVVSLFGIDGKRILTRTISSVGPVSLTWDGLDNTGKFAAAGVYVLKVTRKGFAAEKRITLLK